MLITRIKLKLFLGSLSCSCHLFCSKESLKDASHCKTSGFKLLAYWKAERLCLQQQDNLDCRDKIVRLWLHHYWPAGTVSDLSCGSPRVTTWQQDHNITVTHLWNISANNSHSWHRPWTKKNKFWNCPSRTVCLSKASVQDTYLLFVQLSRFGCCLSAVCPALQHCHCVASLAWARHRLRFRST